MKWYADYVWEKGFPLGKGVLEGPTALSYRIIKDGYDKRISVEKYEHGQYTSTIYDTLLLDFRKINPREQKAWSKELVSESDEKAEFLLRDIDGRVIYKELCYYKTGVLLRADTATPAGQLLASSALFYEGTFQGVVLSDPEGKPVLKKRYSVVDHELTELLETIH